MKPTLIIMAAGMGSRYGGLKQMDPVGPGGEFVIDYSVYDARRAGFGRVIFVIRKDLESAFRETVGHRIEKSMEVEYAFQELQHVPQGFTPAADRVKPWGTGHAVWVAHEKISTPFAVINADDFYGRASFQLLSDFLTASPVDQILVGFPLRNTLSEHGTVSRGLCTVSSGGKLQSIQEHVKIAKWGHAAVSILASGEEIRLTGDEIVSMNMWGFTPAFLQTLDHTVHTFFQTRGHESKSELYLPFVVDQWIQNKKGDVSVRTSPESWFGVTYPEDKSDVMKKISAMIHTGKYPARLWE